MAQAIPSIIEPKVNAMLHSASVSEENKSFLLEHEAFPGELAALRAQNLPVPSPIVNQSPVQQSLAHTSLDTGYLPAEKKLFDQNLLADQLIEVMPTGLVMLDGNGIVVKVNQVALDLLDEPILGQPWFAVITRSFNPREDDWHEISLKDGRRVKLEITSLGAQPGQLIMVTDLTETRLLQDKLAQMQRLSSLGKMVSTLAHQIRTPLSAAILYSENLLTDKLTAVSRLKFQGKLNDRLYDLEQQVNDMLLFSKSGTEQVVAAIAIKTLIHTSVNSMEVLLDKANAEVVINLPDSELTILGNINALTGAIQNLLHNALQATKSHKVLRPHITIQVYSQASHLYISFKDNGPGIDASISEKIFQPFYTSSSKGTGLGLSVVKSVVNAHQGEVSLLNEINAGAHFVIKLPLLAQGKVMQNKRQGEG